MYLIAIAWIYVVLMMAVVEALSPQGSVLGAVFTFLLYGALPLSIVLYLLGTPMRRRRRQVDKAGAVPDGGSAPNPDGGGEPAGDAVSAERKEP